MSFRDRWTKNPTCRERAARESAHVSANKLPPSVSDTARMSNDSGGSAGNSNGATFR